MYKFWSKLFILIIIVFFSSCSEKKVKLFSKLSKGETGIDFRNILKESGEMNVMKYSYFPEITDGQESNSDISLPAAAHW